MNRLWTSISASAAVAVLATTASAYTNDDVTFAGSVGTGASVSYMAVDFGTPTGSYAFKYFFDGPKTAADMLLALDAGIPGLEISSFDFGGGAIFVDTFAYPPNPTTGGVGQYWSYWLGNGQKWEYSQVGAGQRNLANGDWDGWSYVPSFTATAEIPRIPGVPEPSSILALAGMVTSSLFFLRKRG